MSIPYGEDIPLDTLISVATDAVRQAGAVLAECTRTGFRIEHKQIINLVTDADHRAEQRIIDVVTGSPYSCSSSSIELTISMLARYSPGCSGNPAVIVSRG